MATRQEAIAGLALRRMRQSQWGLMPESVKDVHFTRNLILSRLSCVEIMSQEPLNTIVSAVRGLMRSAYVHVEKPSFRIFEMQPRWNLWIGSKLQKERVWGKYQLEKTSWWVCSLKLRQARISITTYTWNSIQNINYMVFTAHFVDNDLKLHKRIINFCTITSYKGEEIGSK